MLGDLEHDVTDCYSGSWVPGTFIDALELSIVRHAKLIFMHQQLPVNEAFIIPYNIIYQKLLCHCYHNKTYKGSM